MNCCIMDTANPFGNLLYSDRSDALYRAPGFASSNGLDV